MYESIKGTVLSASASKISLPSALTSALTSTNDYVLNQRFKNSYCSKHLFHIIHTSGDFIHWPKFVYRTTRTPDHD